MESDLLLIHTLRITLSNGESCTAGSYYKLANSHTFEPNKKITKVEVIIWIDESYIYKINFYSGKERIVSVGKADDAYVKKYGGRRE
jgi:hypothetical protein